MNASRQRILDLIDDPVVKKTLIVRWGRKGTITPEEARELIRANGLGDK